MYKNKRVLLIAGGGALGSHTARELIRLGCTVEVICPEEKTSYNDRLIFHRSLATDELLASLFLKQHYDGIINFLHYNDAEDYKRIYPLLISNTDHLIFLSSYRVYADEQHPITENAARLYDVSKDEDFLQNDRYAVPKSKCEDFLVYECKGENWTVVRPVISFAFSRLDLVMCSGRGVLNHVESDETLLLPECVRKLHAGIDWAGNSGRLIANLLFKKQALGEIFTVYSGHEYTWEQVADAYSKTTGLKVAWVDEKSFIDSFPTIRTHKEHQWMWYYDRKFDRHIDPSKIMRVTGLCREDFSSLEDGICFELKEGNWKK